MRSGLATAALAVLLAVSSALMRGQPARGSPDLLLDEGFEDGVADWVTAGGDLATTSAIAHEGAHSALFSVSVGEATGLIQYQPIPVQPEGDYSLSAFFFKDDPRVESVTLRINWENAGGANVGWSPRVTLTGDEASWRPLAVSTQSPPDAALAAVQVHVVSGEGGLIYLDDVQLEGLPLLPATATPPPTDTPSSAPTTAPSTTSTPTRVPSATPSAVPSPTPAARTRMSLINGDFEEADDGVPSGWQKYGGELLQTSERYRSGSHSGALRSSTESTKWAYQAVAVSAGSAYEFSIYVLLDDPAAQEAFLRISWYTSDDTSGAAIAVSDSPQHLTTKDPAFHYLTTGAALAPETALSAKFRVMLAPASSAPATIYLDDASLQQVAPELAATPAPPPPAEQDEVEADAAEPAGAASGQRNEPAHNLPRQGESPFAVKVNEAMVDPVQPGDDAAYEWVELYNAGRDAVDLAGWTLTDNNASDTLPSLTLMPRGSVVVAASARFRDAYPAFGGAMVALADGRIGTGLANKGDHLLLRDSTGKIVDGVSWGDDETVLSPSVAAIPSGHSIERSPPGHDSDLASDFVDNAKPSPGAGFGERVVAGAAVERQVAGSSVVYPPAQATARVSSSVAPRLFVSLVAGIVSLAVGLSAGFYGRRRFRQWP